MLVAIGNDHCGVSMKEELAEYLQSEGHGVIDCGIAEDEEADYPDVAHTTIKTYFQDSDTDFIILICGTGTGVCIAANKHKGIRAAVTNDAEAARLAKEHNHANCICLGARVIDIEAAKAIIKAYVDAKELEGRHSRRVAKLADIENT